MTRGGRIAVAAWALGALGAAYWLARELSVTTDLSAFLPAGATPSQALLVRQLRDGVASRLILVGIEGGDAPALAAASRALARALAGDRRFGVVANGDAGSLHRELELVRRWRYLLSPGVTAERFTAGGLRVALADALRLLASPLGPALGGSLRSDPTGELATLAVRLAGGTRPMREGVWFAPDGGRAILVAETRAPGYDLDAQDAAAQAIRQAFERVAGSGLALRMSSPGLLAVESRRQIERDVRFASSVTLAGVVLLMLATYRSVWPAALSALPAASGLAAGVVAVSAAFGPVHAITLGFGAMLIGEAIDYPTYLFANNAPGESLEATRIRVGGTLLLAAATTACGALAMLLSGFRGLAQLGLLIVVGVAVAGLVTRYVLPAVTPARALARKRAKSPVDAARMLPLFRRHAWIAAVAALGALAVVLAHREAIWDDDLANLNPVPASSKRMDRELREQSGAPDLRYLVVASAADRESALAASERVADLLDRAIANGWIAGYDAAARYLPSETAQARRRAALPDAPTLRRALDEALADSPFRRDAFDAFLADVEAAREGPLLRRADLDGTALGSRADSLLMPSEDGWAALMPLAGVTDPAAVGAAVAAAQAGDAVMLDLKAEADALIAGYRARSLRSTLAGFVAIVAVVYAGVRSFPATVRMLAPVLGAVLLTVATLLAAGAKLTVFHLVALLLVVGVGLNYALFFGRVQASEEERELTLLAVTVAGLATLCAATALAATGTPVLRAIGVTTALGAVFAFAMSAALSRGSRR